MCKNLALLKLLWNSLRSANKCLLHFHAEVLKTCHWQLFRAHLFEPQNLFKVCRHYRLLYSWLILSKSFCGTRSVPQTNLGLLHFHAEVLKTCHWQLFRAHLFEPQNLSKVCRHYCLLYSHI